MAYTLATVRQEIQRHVPQAADATVDAVVNSIYLKLSEDLPMLPGSITFDTVPGQLDYDLSPGGAYNTGSNAIRLIRHVVYDAGAGGQKIPIVKYFTYEEFIRMVPGYLSMSAGTPTAVVKYGEDVYYLYPAPSQAKQVMMAVLLQPNELGASDKPVGVPEHCRYALIYPALERLAEIYDRAEMIPFYREAAEAEKQRLFRWYQDTMPTEKRLRIFNYRR